MANIKPRKSKVPSRSKHQHWVPQFYLRYFATPATRDSRKPQIWIFSKDSSDGDEKLTSIRNVCGGRYLYSPKMRNGERAWDLDDKLNDLESLLSKLWRPLATDFVDLGNESMRKAIALFVAVMHFRHPATRQDIEEIHRQSVAFYEAIPPRPDGTPSLESVEVKGKIYELDTADWYSYKNWTQDDHDRAFAELVGNDVRDLAEHLLGKRWCVVFSETDTFITTDKPVLSALGIKYGCIQRHSLARSDSLSPNR